MNVRGDGAGWREDPGPETKIRGFLSCCHRRPKKLSFEPNRKFDESLFIAPGKSCFFQT